ncbi:MAG: methyltransferase, partial [Alistipes sp.]|nr:methyltransferase [Alistipes sp.]
MSAFRFKQFAVNQDGVAMKVGTDGVLLGAWAGCTEVDSVLDIGTGTGVIALMLAQRSSARHIVGVDIDTAAVECAAAN